jgi:hypothetical protein
VANQKYIWDRAQQIATVINFGTTELMMFDNFLANGVDFSQTNDCLLSLLPAEANQVSVSFTPTLTAKIK